MDNKFCPKMEQKDINNISMLGLAHIGDAVYELLTRTMLCTDGGKKATELHKKTVAIVNAPAQARAAGEHIAIAALANRCCWKFRR